MTRAPAAVHDGAFPYLGHFTHAPEATRLVNAALRGRSHPWVAHGEGPLDVRTVTVVRGHPGSRWTLRNRATDAIGAAALLREYRRTAVIPQHRWTEEPESVVVWRRRDLPPMR